MSSVDILNDRVYSVTTKTRRFKGASKFSDLLAKDFVCARLNQATDSDQKNLI